MIRRGTSGLFAMMIAEVFALKAPANGFRLPDQDAFATARGEAFVATADNPSAIYYNPAGITQLEGNNLRVGLYGIDIDATYKQPGGGQTFQDGDTLAAIPQFFYACTPEKMPFSFGLGVYAPYGLGVNWPQDTGFRAVATKGEMTDITINPVFAFKLPQNISIGAGMTVSYANTDLQQGLSTSTFFPNIFRFKGSGWGVGYNLGLLWQPYEKISVGTSFHSSVPVTMYGQTEVELLPHLPVQYQSAQTDFTFPLSAAFGISYRPTPKWNLEFDADYTDWSSFGTITVHQAVQPTPFLAQDVSLTLDWQPSWLYELGVTRYFDNGWHVSAGYAYNENSVPDANYTPLAADLDRHFFSIGTGFKGRIFNFDVAYQFGYGPARTVTGSSPSTAGQIAGQTADGTYTFISNAVFVTVGIHF